MCVEQEQRKRTGNKEKGVVNDHSRLANDLTEQQLLLDPMETEEIEVGVVLAQVR
jgi:hypothetical protein